MWRVGERRARGVNVQDSDGHLCIALENAVVLQGRHHSVLLQEGHRLQQNHEVLGRDLAGGGDVAVKLFDGEYVRLQPTVA